MAAFRQGVLRVRFTGPAEATERLQAMADAESLHLITGPLEALDLLDVKDKAAPCREWLQRDSAAQRPDGSRPAPPDASLASLSTCPRARPGRGGARCTPRSPPPGAPSDSRR